MKKITCEMCGGSDIIKQENFFVCQSCGTKYSPEEAKKLIIEGTVKLDNSDRLVKLIDLARRACNTGDYSNAQKYYTMALEEDPHNWEALFYSWHSWAMHCNIWDISKAADSIAKNLNTIFSLIKKQSGDHYSEALEVRMRVVELVTILIKKTDSFHGKPVSHIFEENSEYSSKIISILNLQYKLGDELEYHFPQDKRLLNLAVGMWKDGNNLSNRHWQTRTKNLDPYTKKIQKYEPNYHQPVYESSCYIATSIYGSYDCPNVWRLRRFRDEILAVTFFGKAFIKFYYLLSPKLVKVFGKTNWFKTIFRKIIDKILLKLQAKGIDNTPYFDL